jgi:uncharacterized protein (UPF0303 family)
MLKRTVQFLLKLTDNEYFQLRHIAAKAGFSMSAYIRRCVFSDRRTVIIDPDLVHSIYSEMNMIGSNINQIARIANTDKRIAPESIERVGKVAYENRTDK